MSNTLRSIALVFLLTVLAAPVVVLMASAPMPPGALSLSAPSTDSLVARGAAQDPNGAPRRGPDQDPDGAPRRGPDQDPDGGPSVLRIARGASQHLVGDRLARAEWGGSVASGLSQQVVMTRLLSV